MTIENIMSLADEYVAAFVRSQFMGSDHRANALAALRAAVDQAIEAAVLAEREACKAICRTELMPAWAEACDLRDVLAEAINARGGK